MNKEFNYMMLSRLKMDCEYFLKNGNGSLKHLWAGNIDNQIKEMKKLYNQLEVKPDWLTKEDIINYHFNMLNYRSTK